MTKGGGGRAIRGGRFFSSSKEMFTTNVERLPTSIASKAQRMPSKGGTRLSVANILFFLHIYIIYIFFFLRVNYLGNIYMGDIYGRIRIVKGKEGKKGGKERETLSY